MKHDSPSPVRASAQERAEHVCDDLYDYHPLGTVAMANESCKVKLAQLVTDAIVDAEARGRQQAEQPALNVSELREGEENDGPLQSTDLHLEGRGISLLCNVTAGQRFTYSLIVDGNKVETGTVGVYGVQQALVDKALRYDLDRIGITQREKEAVELVELRAQVAALTQALKDAKTALAHLKCCGDCAEDSWEACEGGRHVVKAEAAIDAALTGAQAKV